ncbi:hypothetical protein [Colwellia sp. RSH04]|uniref:hypothetical protein n=1 Tax=Colwellia sp. RSH04 TaxID=2305464 RepID=UPI000E5820C9|nr:hypothetical protein [Colwellia sp. RSH04]RHW74804.1 hypothetical protein D1094_16780 [Colwellia sp. RSH04]
MNLEKIDTSYWLTKDKTWVEQRKAQWPAIEKVVGLNLNKAEVNVTKAYYLRGKMPNWGKYRDWEDLFRPLDLMLFLWLHPSEDPEVLKPLYNTYMESDLIHPDDVTKGYVLFIENELRNAITTKKKLKDYSFPYMGKKNITLFRILFVDIEYAKAKAASLVSPKSHEDKIGYNIGYLNFTSIWQWLMQDLKLPQAADCLYQYDEVLDWCLTTFNEKNEQEFLTSLEHKVNQTLYQKALYCIYHFDQEKGEVSCRSRALVKVRQLLDDNDFVPEFKQMWEGIKSGEIEVKNPWKRR